MRYLLFVEGDTERKGLVRFLKRWLDKYIQPRVGLTPVKFTGCSDYISECAKKARLYLEGPGSSEIIAIVGLLDLHNAPILEDVHDAQDRARRIEEEMEKKVANERFRQFVAIHETEAWLFSDSQVFPAPIRQAIKESPEPEIIDDGNPPSRRLGELYRIHTKRDYKKVVDGADLFAKLDPEVAANRCPSLNKMLNEMRMMALGRGHRA